MNDRQCLKIIANPYLLKKDKFNKPPNTKIIEMNNNDLLYKYLENKYKNTYISPVLFYKIIETIDQEINNIIIHNIVEEIISEICNKFD
tara:strand:+ start:742 stop:1008 length:267 start_codon:yes stop_codon:yes gene_type:complete